MENLSGTSVPPGTPNLSNKQAAHNKLESDLTQLYQAIKQQQETTHTQVRALIKSSDAPLQTIQSEISNLLKRIGDLDTSLKTYTRTAETLEDLDVAPLLRKVTYELKVAQEELVKLQTLHALYQETKPGGSVDRIAKITVKEYREHPPLYDCIRQLDQHLTVVDDDLRILNKQVQGEIQPSIALDRIEQHLEELTRAVNNVDNDVLKLPNLPQGGLDDYHQHSDRVREKILQLQAQHAAFQTVFPSSTPKIFHAVDSAHESLKGITKENATAKCSQAFEALYQAHVALRQGGKERNRYNEQAFNAAEQAYQTVKREFNAAYETYIKNYHTSNTAESLGQQIIKIHHTNINGSKEEVLREIRSFETELEALRPEERAKVEADSQFVSLRHAYTRHYQQFCIPIREEIAMRNRLQQDVPSLTQPWTANELKTLNRMLTQQLTTIPTVPVENQREAIIQFELMWGNLQPADQKKLFVSDPSFKDLFEEYSNDYASQCQPLRNMVQAITAVHVHLNAPGDSPLRISQAYKDLDQVRRALPDITRDMKDGRYAIALEDAYIRTRAKCDEYSNFANQSRPLLQLFPENGAPNVDIEPRRLQQLLGEKIVAVQRALVSEEAYGEYITQQRMVDFEEPWASLTTKQQEELKGKPEFAAMLQIYEQATQPYAQFRNELLSGLQPLAMLHHALSDPKNDESDVLILWTRANQALRRIDLPDGIDTRVNGLLDRAKTSVDQLMQRVMQKQEQSLDRENVLQWRDLFGSEKSKDEYIVPHPNIAKMIIQAISELRYNELRYDSHHKFSAYVMSESGERLITIIEHALSVQVPRDARFSFIIEEYRKDFSPWITNTTPRANPPEPPPPTFSVPLEITDSHFVPDGHFDGPLIIHTDHMAGPPVAPSKSPTTPSLHGLPSSSPAGTVEALLQNLEQNTRVKLNLAIEAFKSALPMSPLAGTVKGLLQNIEQNTGVKLNLAIEAFKMGKDQASEETKAAAMLALTMAVREAELTGREANMLSRMQSDKPLDLEMFANIVLKKIALINWTPLQFQEVYPDAIQGVEDLWALADPDQQAQLRQNKDFGEIFDRYSQQYATEIARVGKRTG